MHFMLDARGWWLWGEVNKSKYKFLCLWACALSGNLLPIDFHDFLKSYGLVSYFQKLHKFRCIFGIQIVVILCTFKDSGFHENNGFQDPFFFRI